MKVLVAEDDETKREKILGLLIEHYPEWVIIEARSFQSGLRAVEDDEPDLIILDMTMRNYDKSIDEDGGKPHHFAGREILRQMKREGIYKPSIIMTQFDEFGDEGNKTTLEQLKQELEKRFPSYRGTVRFRHNIDSWKQELLKLIKSSILEIEK